MTRTVLSIGSNLGDRLAHLQSVVDGLDGCVRAVSPVYESDAWGGVEQGPFLNAVVIAEHPDRSPADWLRIGQEFENAAGRVREIHWGPRTLDVDIIVCQDGSRQLRSDDPQLTLPHPYAHLRAFVLIPWLAADPDALLWVTGAERPVAALLAELDAKDRAGVRPTDLVLSP